MQARRPGRRFQKNQSQRGGNRPRRNNFIDYPVVKQKLIDYLFDMTSVSKHRYTIVRDEEDLERIGKNHSVGYNYRGMNALLVFVRQQDKYHSFIINKSSIRHRKEQVDISKVKLIPVELGVDMDMYRGTVFDGTFLPFQEGRKKTFIINDMYKLNGKNTQTEKIRHKQIKLRSYLKNMVSKDATLNRLDLVLNQFVPLNRIHELETRKGSETYSHDINGYMFLPDYSGNRVIFINDLGKQIPHHGRKEKEIETKTGKTGKTSATNPTQTNKHKHTDNKELATISRQKRKPVTSSVTDSDVYLTFEMRKTGKVDVYDLCLISKAKGGASGPSIKRFANAYIPTLELSRLCKQLLGSNNETLVRCKYLPETKHWLPVDKADQPYPDTLRKAKKKLIKFLKK